MNQLVNQIQEIQPNTETLQVGQNKTELSSAAGGVLPLACAFFKLQCVELLGPP